MFILRQIMFNNNKHPDGFDSHVHEKLHIFNFWLNEKVLLQNLTASEL